METDLSTRYGLFPTATADQVVAKLLSIGGTDVLRYTFDNLPSHILGLLLEEGRVFNGQVVLEPGEPQECHKNTYFRTFFAPCLEPVSGFALVESDGRWVAHSWVLDGGNIVETTVPRDVYFGVDGLIANEILYYHGRQTRAAVEAE